MSSGLNRVRGCPDPANAAIEAEANTYFDLFLVEIVAVREALAQIANAVFALGQNPNEVSVNSAHAGIQSARNTEDTGLYEWIVLKSTTNNWWWRLADYRNQIAHRRFLAFAQIVRSIEVGGDNPTRGRVPVELLIAADGGQELPLLTYVDESHSQVLRLADSTLCRFAELLR
jgi:hypothetical protein